MHAIYDSFFLLVLMICFLAGGIWIFASMILVSIVGLTVVLHYPLIRVGDILASRLYAAAGTWEIACIPLFMWMGEILFRTDISDRLFRGLAPLVDKLPGRLLHTNVAGCVLFAAVSGSSAATTATIGKITTTELINRGYSPNLAIGSLAGAGSFGLMIPPSIVFIVYGVLAEESISKLFTAGVFPGLLFGVLYSTYIMIYSSFNPDVAPKVEQQYSFRQYLHCFLDLLPITILILMVLGSIYTGIATPTEAAAVGVASSLIMTLLMRQLTFKIFMESLLGALKMSCMVCSLLAAAAFLSTAMGFLHIPMDISIAISRMHLSPYGLIGILAVFYIVLGFFLDGISITVMSLPICLPLIKNAGFDPIWFGVFLVAMTEIAQITPPVGFNLFVIQGLTGRPIYQVAYWAMPFFFLMLIGIVLFTLFPQIALYLPHLLFST